MKLMQTPSCNTPRIGGTSGGGITPGNHPSRKYSDAAGAIDSARGNARKLSPATSAAELPGPHLSADESRAKQTVRWSNNVKSLKAVEKHFTTCHESMPASNPQSQISISACKNIADEAREMTNQLDSGGSEFDSCHDIIQKQLTEAENNQSTGDRSKLLENFKNIRTAITSIREMYEFGFEKYGATPLPSRTLVDVIKKTIGPGNEILGQKDSFTENLCSNYFSRPIELQSATSAHDAAFGDRVIIDLIKDFKEREYIIEYTRLVLMALNYQF